MEVDHFYIFIKYPKETGDILVQFGLVESSSNVHPGQGTANRRFFFHNSMLELLYVANPEELNAEKIKATGLYDQ
ncbi:VOC family protein [Leptospira sarikeiensis]|uniref:Glyoxalase-like domain-containing protein n=1 Tax=Leptospira sarikeiensis TaxID=2484943 RepID=A0A4V3JR66_9LEPT|nr:VOC family protein [Leptospira sarikeiensis]TGL58865.1 hypothetical protein EHQ64_17640 [Leptospira sarikeiensis]